jgi:hypothetical protein
MASYFVLNTGAKIPSVGLGTWQADSAVVGDAVYAAVKVSPSASLRPCFLLDFQLALCFCHGTKPVAVHIMSSFFFSH